MLHHFIEVLLDFQRCFIFLSFFLDVDKIAKLFIVKNAKKLKIHKLNLVLLSIDVCILDFVGVRELANVHLMLLDYIDETKRINEVIRTNVAT